MENLFSDDAPMDNSPLPYACLHAKYLRNAGWELSRFRRKLESSAAAILKGFPQRSDEDETNPVCYYLPEGRSELRRRWMAYTSGDD